MNLVQKTSIRGLYCRPSGQIGYLSYLGLFDLFGSKAQSCWKETLRKNKISGLVEENKISASNTGTNLTEITAHNAIPMLYTG